MSIITLILSPRKHVLMYQREALAAHHLVGIVNWENQDSHSSQDVPPVCIYTPVIYWQLLKGNILTTYKYFEELY